MDVIAYLHSKFVSPLIRRDVILVMAKWDEFAWLSDQINDFQSISAWERRAFIIASFKMRDAGSKWRDRMKRSFNSLELVVRDWTSEKIKVPGWNIPI